MAHFPEVAGARVGALDHNLGGYLGRQLHLFVGRRVPPDRVLDEGEQVSGVHALRFGQEAGFAEQSVHSLGVALGDGALAGQLQFHRPRFDALVQAEVQERDAAVGEQHEVAGMGIAGELTMAVETAQVEAKDDLADAVALGLRSLLDRLEADPFDELLTSTRSRESEVTTSGTAMNGWPAKMRASERWFCASSS